MKAALISLGSISSKWTAEAMEKYFDSVDMLDVRKIEISIGAKKDARLLYEGKPLPGYDCVYAKGSFRYSAILRAITGLLQGNTYLPIKDNSFTLVHNKLLTHLVLQKAEIPMPITYLTSTISAARRLLEKVNYPIVMKFPEGTQGKGVMFADSYSSGSSLLDALHTMRQPFVIQEYVETGSTDIRAIVVGDRVVASMQRIAVQGEKRANIHAGGMGEAVILDSHTKRLAVKASKALGAEICGVDILQGVHGPLIIELNLSPGLQGIKKTTGIDVAKHIAKYLHGRANDLKATDTKASHSDLMKDLGLDDSLKNQNQILGNIQMRGGRILLPEFASNSGITEDDELVIRVDKKKIEITTI